MDLKITRVNKFANLVKHTLKVKYVILGLIYFSKQNVLPLITLKVCLYNMSCGFYIAQSFISYLDRVLISFYGLSVLGSLSMFSMAVRAAYSVNSCHRCSF